MVKLEKSIIYSVTEPSKEVLWMHCKDKQVVIEFYGPNGWEPIAGGAGSQGGGMVEISYADLKQLRNAGQLIPGQQYRITDYHCATTQENTRSADNQFDIIVIADSANVLNENARAVQHNSQKNKPTLFIGRSGGDFNGEYPLTRASSEDVVIGGVSYYGWDAGDDWIWYTTSETPLDNSAVYSIYDDEEIESYPVTEVYFYYSADTYFDDCNLATWELKYSIDNDYERFAWAGIDGYESALVCWAWGSDSDGFLRKTTDFTEEGNEIWEVVYPSRFPDDREDMASSDLLWIKAYDGERRYAVYEDETPNYITFYSIEESWRESWGCYVDQWGPIMCAPQKGGTGVIYYMKDEWNNECPYDFKNIQFKTTLWGDHFDPEFGREVYAYTCCTYKPYQGDLIEDTSLHGDANNINIYPSSYEYEGDEPQQILPGHLLLGTYVSNVTIGKNSFDVVIEGVSSSITLGCNTSDILLNECDHINIGEECKEIVLSKSAYIDIGRDTDSVDFTQVFYTKVGRSCSDLTFGVDGYYTYTQGIEVGDFCHNIKTAENFHLDCDLKIGKACNNLTLALSYSGANYGNLLATILPYTRFDSEYHIYLDPMTSSGNYLQIIGRDGENNRTIEYGLTPVAS